MTTSKLARVAVVGRPNVGKSTLVNRLAQRMDSIVGPMPGLTRDRLGVEAEWRGRRFMLNDTGGLMEEALGPNKEQTITAKVASAALAALDTADVVLFVVDGTAGVTSDELALVKRLRRVKVPVVVAANKIEGARNELPLADFWSLGLGEPMPVSALHGRGTGDLLDRIYELLPPEQELEDREEIPSIAIVGRPNVGKSALFNLLVGEERSIVHDEPGTTRDSVDSLVEIDGRRYRFIDTAGIRRRAKTHDVEVYSASRTRQAIERADVAVLVVDAREGATAQDQRIARQVADAGVGCVVAMNKWDLVEDEEMAKIAERSLEDRLQFVDYATLVRTSARTRRAVGRLIPAVNKVLENRTTRVRTAPLNELIHAAQQKAPPPAVGGRHPRVLYATQAETAPPTFVLFASAPLAPSWQRFIERRLREEFDFGGNPIRIVVRERVRPERR